MVSRGWRGEGSEVWDGEQEEKCRIERRKGSVQCT